MASPFDEIDAAGQAVIAGRTGEAITLIGMTGGDYSKSPDLDRPAQETQAVLALSPRMMKALDGIQGASSTGSGRTHMNSELLITEADFYNLDWLPVRDDVVVIREGLPQERRFTISASLPCGFGDVQILLSEEKSAR